MKPDFEILEEQPVVEGKGMIMVSGSTVHGNEGTEFMKSLEVGDSLIVQIDGQKEERKLNMVLSNKSCGLEEPFSSDLSTWTEFKYQKKP